MRKTQVMRAAQVVSFGDSNLLPKKSGMVREPMCWVIILVRLPRMTHAMSEPMIAFPSPAQVAATPKFQPNCPA